MEQSGDGVGEAAKEAQPVGLTRKRSAACRRPRADPLDLDALVAPAPPRHARLRWRARWWAGLLPTESDGDAEEEEEEDDELHSDMRLARKTRKRGGQSWTPQEDATISAAVLHTPPGSRPSWSDFALSLCGRTGKQCRDRYNGQLQPGISKLDWTEQEERTLAEAYCRQGSRWAALARLLPGRTENNVKNHWHATLRCKGCLRAPAALRYLKVFQLANGLGTPLTVSVVLPSGLDIPSLCSPKHTAERAHALMAAAAAAQDEQGAAAGMVDLVECSGDADNEAAPSEKALTVAEVAALSGEGIRDSARPDEGECREPACTRVRAEQAGSGGAGAAVAECEVDVEAEMHEMHEMHDACGHSVLVTSATLDPEEVIRRVRCLQAPELSSFISSASLADALASRAAHAQAQAHVDGALEAALKCALSQLRSRWPCHADVVRVAVALRTGPLSPGDVYAVAAVSAGDCATACQVVAFLSAQFKQLSAGA